MFEQALSSFKASLGVSTPTPAPAATSTPQSTPTPAGSSVPTAAPTTPTPESPAVVTATSEGQQTSGETKPQETKPVETPVHTPTPAEKPTEPVKTELTPAPKTETPPVQQPQIDTKELLESIKKIVTENKTPPQQTPLKQETKPPEKTPEEIAADNQKLLDKFYENPQEVLEEIKKKAIEDATKNAETKAQEIIKKHDEQLQQQYQDRQKWEKKADDFTKNHPEYKDYYTDMVQIIKDYNLRGRDDAFEKALTIAKANKLETNPPAKPQTFDEMLKDQNNINLLLQNKDIKSKFVQAYLQEVAKGQPPVTVSTSTGQAPVTPPAEKPKTFEEAKRQFLSSLK